MKYKFHLTTFCAINKSSFPGHVLFVVVFFFVCMCVLLDESVVGGWSGWLYCLITFVIFGCLLFVCLLCHPIDNVG